MEEGEDGEGEEKGEEEEAPLFAGAAGGPWQTADAALATALTSAYFPLARLLAVSVKAASAVALYAGHPHDAHEHARDMACASTRKLNSSCESSRLM